MWPCSLWAVPQNPLKGMSHDSVNINGFISRNVSLQCLVLVKGRCTSLWGYSHAINQKLCCPDHLPYPKFYFKQCKTWYKSSNFHFLNLDWFCHLTFLCPIWNPLHSLSSSLYSADLSAAHTPETEILCFSLPVQPHQAGKHASPSPACQFAVCWSYIGIKLTWTKVFTILQAQPLLV